MVNILENIRNKPKWMTDYSYLTVMGSRAYGTENENSDWDYYGFCVPPIEFVFPHTKGEILGFGRNIQRFEQFEEQNDEFDLTIYSIVKYFQLVMEGNPNMVDSLFTPWKSVVHSDNIGKAVKENRHIFLSQKCFHSFKGMMWSHLSRMKSGHVKASRKPLEEEFGFDVKDAYHSVRMILEIEQILFEGGLDLQRNSEVLKGVRSGANTKEEIIDFCESKLIGLENLLKKESKNIAVPYSPDESKIKQLLVDCLEEKYGKLNKIGFLI